MTVIGIVNRVTKISQMAKDINRCNRCSTNGSMKMRHGMKMAPDHASNGAGELGRTGDILTIILGFYVQELESAQA